MQASQYSRNSHFQVFNTPAPQNAGGVYQPGPGAHTSRYTDSTSFGAPAYNLPSSQGATLGQIYAGLEQTRKDIKSIRGGHGSKLAVAGGVIGGVALVGGATPSAVLLAGVAAVGAGDGNMAGCGCFGFGSPCNFGDTGGSFNSGSRSFVGGSPAPSGIMLHPEQLAMLAQPIRVG